MVTLAIERLRIFRAVTMPVPVSGKKLAAVLGWLALIAAAWFLAKACALALSPLALPAAPAFSSTAVPPSRKPGPGQPSLAHFAVLETNNLFNLKSHAPAASSSLRPLNAILMGTVEAPLPEDTRAVIQHQGKQHMLRPGQDIAGYVVKEIRRGAVVLEANGRIEELVTGNSEDLAAIGKPARARGAQGNGSKPSR